MSKGYMFGKELSIEEIKDLQMDVLDAIDEFCENNCIRYSLACGTLLGAIRHKGYIPWDDDIDIYVPRDDYVRLISTFPDTYKGRYKIASLERDTLWELPYAKAYNIETILKENANKKRDIGVNIDIFPIDDVPCKKDWEEYDKSRRRLLSFYSLLFVRFSLNRSVIKNIVIALAKLTTGVYSKRKWAYIIDKKAKEFNGKGMEYCFETCQGLLQKNPFKKELFNHLSKIPFENRFFMAFVDADSYLRNGYGDYMQLPPEDKRISHHSFKAYWKTLDCN